MLSYQAKIKSGSIIVKRRGSQQARRRERDKGSDEGKKEMT